MPNTVRGNTSLQPQECKPGPLPHVKRTWGVLKDWVPLLCSPSTKKFQLFMHLCPAVCGTGGTALGEASQGRPAFEDLIWLCIIQSPKSTFQRVTAALSAVSVHSRDLANGVW